MAATSLNRWPVLKPGDKRLRTGVIPGTTLKVTCRDVVLPLLLAVEADINAKIIPLAGGKEPNGPDGWEYRAARASNGFSNHASGTAIDNRYDVMRADRKKHLTDAQHGAMHAILDKYRTTGGKRVLGWGGDWREGVYMDEMHIEIGQSWQPGVGSPVTAADVANVIARHGIRPDGTTKPPVVNVPPVVVPGWPVPTPLTGLRAFSIGPAKLQYEWDRGKDATSWEIRTVGRRTQNGVALRNSAQVWGLTRGETVTITVTPRNSRNHGKGATIKAVVR